MMYTDIDDAYAALLDAEHDAEADGNNVEECFADLVDSVALACDDATARELYRYTGCADRRSSYDPLTEVGVE